jgi:hypothetical protein
MTYSRFHDYTPSPIGARRSGSRTTAPLPVWLCHYLVFPRVLFVLTGVSRPVLDHRVQDLRAMAAGNPLAGRLACKVPLGAAVLEYLEADGPSAAVWTPLAGEETGLRGTSCDGSHHVPADPPWSHGGGPLHPDLQGLFHEPRLSFKAKGIFGLISTHRDGSGITAKRLLNSPPMAWTRSGAGCARRPTVARSAVRIAVRTAPSDSRRNALTCDKSEDSV